jgi:catalase
MDGFGSHTYMWINGGGERFWVKYHFKTDQGVDFLTQRDADALAGENADAHRQDLWEAIDSGEHPSWTLHVQVMPFEDAAGYRFNPFDLTKVWPHGDYPLIEVGRMTLDENPEDFFVHIEQAAFEPSNMVPGIGPSPDKMLLGRLFSYPDTHRYRIGANYAQLPPNRPHVPVHSYAKDGAMRFEPNRVGAPYAPNSYGGPTASPEANRDLAGWRAAGEMVREAYTLRAEDDDFGQPGTLVRDVMDDAARDRLVGNVSGHLSDGVSGPVQARAFAYWRQVDQQIGDRIAAATKSA